MEHLVCKSEELPDGEVRIVELDGREIGVFRRGGDTYAYLNVCPHQGGPACEGLRIPQVEDVIDARGFFVGQRFDECDQHIVCPWHGYEFHLATGRHVRDPNVALKSFPVLIRDGSVYVTV